MAKKIFPIYLEVELHERFKYMYENTQFKRGSYYAMFVDCAEKELLKFEKEQEKENNK